MVPVLIGIVLLMRKGKIMAISYNGLWKLLIDNNMNKGDLCKKTGLSSSTMAKMTNGESVKLSVLERICKELMYFILMISSETQLKILPLKDV